MLSTKYRLRLQAICARIAAQQPVELQDRIWANKLGQVNRTAASMLRQAQRRGQNPEMHEGGLDDFLNQLDIGGLGDQAKGIRRFDSPEEIVDFFRQDKPEDWRQRDSSEFAGDRIPTFHQQVVTILQLKMADHCQRQVVNHVKVTRA